MRWRRRKQRATEAMTVTARMRMMMKMLGLRLPNDDAWRGREVVKTAGEETNTLGGVGGCEDAIVGERRERKREEREREREKW